MPLSNAEMIAQLASFSHDVQIEAEHLGVRYVIERVGIEQRAIGQEQHEQIPILRLKTKDA